MDTAALPTVEQVQILPTWLVPDRATTLALKRENEMVVYPALFERVIDAMCSGATFKQAVRDDPRGDVDFGRFKRWVHSDETRQAEYDRACQIRSYEWADRVVEHATAADLLEDVNRSQTAVGAYKWLIAADNRRRYGETKQIEQNITVDLRQAMGQGERRLTSDVIDVEARNA